MAKVNSFQKGDETRKRRKSQLERIQEMKSHMEDTSSNDDNIHSNDCSFINATIITPITKNVKELNTTVNSDEINASINSETNSEKNFSISSEDFSNNKNTHIQNNNIHNDIYNPDNVDLSTFFDQSKNTVLKNITRTFSIDAALINSLNSIAKSKKLKRSVFYRTLIGIAIKEELSDLSNNLINGGSLGRKKKTALTISIPVEYDEILKAKLKTLSKEYPEFIFTKSDIMEVLLTNISKRFN